MTKFLGQMANNRNSNKVLIQRQCLELPGDIVAVEMDAQERPELVA